MLLLLHCPSRVALCVYVVVYLQSYLLPVAVIPTVPIAGGCDTHRSDLCEPGQRPQK